MQKSKELQQRIDESYLSFVRRLTDYLITKKIDYSEWGDAILGVDNNYSSENLRKASYVVAKMLDKFENDLIENSDEAIFDLIEEQRDNLYKEKVRVADQNRLKRNLLRQEARYENLLEFLEEQLKNLPKLEIKKYRYVETPNVEATLLLSDIHFGLVCDNALNYYDTEVANERLGKLFDKVKNYCVFNSVKTLHINLLGDLINGVIKLQHRVDAEEDVITQILHISEILSNYINDLKPYVGDIKVYGVVGNHSRVNENKKDNMPSENFERLIFKYIELRIGQPIISNGLEDWLMYKVGDKNIYISHGDKDTTASIRDNAINLTGIVPQICYLGHIHHQITKDENGTETVSNGSIISTDDYAVSIRKHTRAYQIMQVFLDDDVVTYKINLN